MPDLKETFEQLFIKITFYFLNHPHSNSFCAQGFLQFRHCQNGIKDFVAIWSFLCFSVYQSAGVENTCNRKTVPCAHWVGRTSVHSTFCFARRFHSRQTCAHLQRSWTVNRPKMFSSSSLGRYSTVFSIPDEAVTASVCSSSSLSDTISNQQ